ncbi:hypothetical protein Tco_0716677 [Tanacetum coccineum]
MSTDRTKRGCTLLSDSELHESQAERNQTQPTEPGADLLRYPREANNPIKYIISFNQHTLEATTRSGGGDARQLGSEGGGDQRWLLKAIGEGGGGRIFLLVAGGDWQRWW